MAEVPTTALSRFSSPPVDLSYWAVVALWLTLLLTLWRIPRDGSLGRTEGSLCVVAAAATFASPWWQCCAAVEVLGTGNGTASASGVVHRRFRAPLPPHCPRNRLLRFRNDFGGHNNQLITLLNALEIATAMNLTLLLPDFMEGVIPLTPKLISPSVHYDWSLFRAANYCFIYRL
eukprot:RCo006546